MPTPTFTVIEPSSDQPVLGLRNVGRENALLQHYRPLPGNPDWRDLQHGQFTRCSHTGQAAGGYHYIVRGEDQP